MFLETERLILRKFRAEDFYDFCEYAIDPEMCRMMGRADIHDAASARPTFDWLKDKEPRGYVLVLKENNKVIGNLTVYNTCYLQETVDALKGKVGRSLSFSISRHYQRQGLMFEAVQSVIDYLFEAEDVDYIHCGNFDFNIPSRELQKKLGFTHLTTDHFTENGVEYTSSENILWCK